MLAASLALSVLEAEGAPTRNTARGNSENIVFHLADEKPGSNNGSNNTSCCSSDPKGSSNSSSNRSVNYDDFREDKLSGKKGPTTEQLIRLTQFLKKFGINFKVRGHNLTG